MDPHALQDGVEFVVPLRLREPLQRLFFGRVVTFAHGLLPSLTIVRKCSLGYRATPSQRLVCEEHTHQDCHGNDQERDGQVSQSPGPFRTTTCGQGSERSESKPGHGVQRIAVDDRSDSPDEPQRRGYPHKELEALIACSSTSAHLLTFRVSGWNSVSISSSGLSRYAPKRLEEKRSPQCHRAVIDGIMLIAPLEDLAQEVAWCQAKQPEVFILRSFPRNDVVKSFGLVLYSLR